MAAGAFAGAYFFKSTLAFGSSSTLGGGKEGSSVEIYGGSILLIKISLIKRSLGFISFKSVLNIKGESDWLVDLISFYSYCSSENGLGSSGSLTISTVPQ